MSYFWLKDTKAYSGSILIKITLLGRNFTTVRNNEEGHKDRKESCFPVPPQFSSSQIPTNGHFSLHFSQNKANPSLILIKTLGYNIAPEPNTFTISEPKMRYLSEYTWQ